MTNASARRAPRRCDGASAETIPNRPRRARVRRPDPRTVHLRATETTLTGVAGLVGFGVFLRELDVDAELRRTFGRLKPDSRVVFPMAAQMRLLIEAAVVGEARVFGLEALANDPLFVHLAGGVVPSIDTVYRDLCCFDDKALAALDSMLAEHGLAPLAKAPPDIIHPDVDTTVEPLFGSQTRETGRPDRPDAGGLHARRGSRLGARRRP